MITPGTQFMHALHNKIVHHLETSYHTNPDGTPIKVIFHRRTQNITIFEKK